MEGGSDAALFFWWRARCYLAESATQASDAGAATDGGYSGLPVQRVGARRGKIVNSAKAICTASLLLVMLSGCATDPGASARNQEPRWTKVHVAGSRIARRVDSFGNAD